MAILVWIYCNSYDTHLLGRWGRGGRRNRPIISIKMDTLEEKIYPSAAQASRDLEIDKTSISKCLRGLKPQAGGYKFVYYEREEENGIKDC